jgi:diacylglycerol kinase family enzyme/membrane-associated phospholipid phosphatase
MAALLASLLLVTAVVAAQWGPLMSLDSDVAREAYEVAATRSWLVSALDTIAVVGHPTSLRLVLLLVAVYLVIRRWTRAALFVALAALISAAAAPAVKALVGRTRPEWVDPIGTAAGHSFPSGHATGGAVFATALVLVTVSSVRRGLRRRLLILLLVAVAVVLGLDRIFLGVHYLSDVVAGWLLGTALTMLVWEVVVARAAVAPVALPGTVGPAPSYAAVVVNPTKVADMSGFRALVESRAEACEWQAPLWSETTAEDPGRGMAEQALAAGADMVLAAGGDGTVRVLCHELARTGVPIGIVPLGTGNLLARNLSLPLHPRDAIDVALLGQDRAVDIVQVDGDDLPETAFTVMAGLGLDAAIMMGAPDELKKRIGWPAYLVSGMQQLFRYPLGNVEITIDDLPPVRVRARTVVIGNVGLLQAGFPLLPDARIDDGELDVVVIAPRSRRDWLAVAVRLAGRQRRTDERLARMRGRRIVVRSDKPQPRQLDGDPISVGRELRAEVQAGVLLVRVPRTVPR